MRIIEGLEFWHDFVLQKHQKEMNRNEPQLQIKIFDEESFARITSFSALCGRMGMEHIIIHRQHTFDQS